MSYLSVNLDLTSYQDTHTQSIKCSIKAFDGLISDGLLLFHMGIQCGNLSHYLVCTRKKRRCNSAVMKLFLQCF